MCQKITVKNIIKIFKNLVLKIIDINRVLDVYEWRRRERQMWRLVGCG